MGKIGKLLIRILITVVIFFIVLYTVEKLLKFRNNLNNKEWNWSAENNTINKMLVKKQGKNYFPMVINKNDDISTKAEDEKRILVIGDSFVWGFGSTNVNYTWWKQLNKKIHEEGYTNVNVYGAGYFGYNTEDELNYILNNDKIINKIDPDMIIIGYVYNDPEQRDVNNENIIRNSWENQNTIFYKLFPNLNSELRVRISKMTNNHKLLVFIGKIFGYRWDVRVRLISEGESKEYYQKVLKKVDKKIKKLDIPYFYYFNTIFQNSEINIANQNIYDLMNSMDISSYYNNLPNFKYDSLYVNPADSHPGIVLTNYYANDVYNILKKDYNTIFEDNKIINTSLDFNLNINDTMPYLDFHKVNDNIYWFEYPKEEKKRTINSNFLYYPINKNYIKLNLEYPKTVSKVKIKSRNGKLKNVNLYVNTYNDEAGFDLDESHQKVTECEDIGDYTFDINKKITSLNISAEFSDKNERQLQIEFIEE